MRELGKEGRGGGNLKKNIGKGRRLDKRKLHFTVLFLEKRLK